jgi:hypothetical protein
MQKPKPDPNLRPATCPVPDENYAKVGISPLYPQFISPVYVPKLVGISSFRFIYAA